MASNASLCHHVDRLEQLVLHRRSAFASQQTGQQMRLTDRHMPSSAVPGNAVSHSVGSGSRRQACTTRSNVDTGDLVLQRSCCTPWRSKEQSDRRHARADKNLSCADAHVRYRDVWTVNNQQDHWQNASDLLDVDAWPDGASVDTQCEYFFVVSLITVGLY